MSSRMVYTALTAYSDIGLLAVRVVLGAVFLFHGWPKVSKSAALAQGMKWSSWQVLLLGVWESVGALSVLLGVYPQIGAIMLGIVMLGALYHKIVMWKVPFTSMNSTGWEFDLALLAMSVSITLLGGGAIALLL